MKKAFPKKTGDNEGEVAIKPADIAEYDKQGDHRHLKRDHHCAQDDDKERDAQRPVDAGQSVGNPGAGKDGADNRGGADEKGVGNVAREWHKLETVDVVVKGNRIGDPL